MSTAAPQTPAVRPAREIRVVNDESPIAYLIDTARFEQTQRIAMLMARASLMPQHLQKGDENERQANAFLIVGQSLRWGLDPFAVAPETYVVGGKLGFQGKLIAAVINARAGLVGPLEYYYNEAKGDDFAIVVVGYEQAVVWDDALEALIDAVVDTDSSRAERKLARMGVKVVRVTVGQAKTTNEIWKKDPKQKLVYTGAIKWARRHRPEIILGVVTEEDIDAMEARLANAKPAIATVLPPPIAQSFRSLPAPAESTPISTPPPAAGGVPRSETPTPAATAPPEQHAPETAPVADLAPEPAAATTSLPSKATPAQGVRNLCSAPTIAVSDAAVMMFLRSQGIDLGAAETLDEVQDIHLAGLIAGFASCVPALKRMQGTLDAQQTSGPADESQDEGDQNRAKLRDLLAASELTEEALMAYLRSKRSATAKHETLDQLNEGRIGQTLAAWPQIKGELLSAKGVEA